MPAWLVPTLGYVVLLGAAGVTTRLALRTITWEQMVLWVPVAYLTFAVILAAARGAREDPPRTRLAGRGSETISVRYRSGELDILTLVRQYGLILD